MEDQDAPLGAQGVARPAARGRRGTVRSRRREEQDRRRDRRDPRSGAGGAGPLARRLARISPADSATGKAPRRRSTGSTRFPSARRWPPSKATVAPAASTANPIVNGARPTTRARAGSPRVAIVQSRSPRHSPRGRPRCRPRTPLPATRSDRPRRAARATTRRRRPRVAGQQPDTTTTTRRNQQTDREPRLDTRSGSRQEDERAPDQERRAGRGRATTESPHPESRDGSGANGYPGDQQPEGPPLDPVRRGPDLARPASRRRSRRGSLPPSRRSATTPRRGDGSSRPRPRSRATRSSENNNPGTSHRFVPIRAIPVHPTPMKAATSQRPCCGRARQRAATRTRSSRRPGRRARCRERRAPHLAAARGDRQGRAEHDAEPGHDA